ncbi:MAG TPA: STAS domain-containing protein [Micromonosporaceae bacterium]
MDVSSGEPATQPGEDTVIEVTVSGALDTAGVARLDTVLRHALARRPRHLVVDLADCPFLTASAIALLVEAHRRAWLVGGLLTLRSPSPRVRRILKIARVDHLLHVTPPAPTAPDGDAGTGEDTVEIERRASTAPTTSRITS